MRLPDFIVIGAMKCGTSGLHDRLAARSGLFLSTPKEPNFFSDDPVYARGEGWYRSLFAGARSDQLCGEASTHYTKAPIHPHSCDRMRSLLEDVRLVYVMRDPVDRIVSQYIHQWTENDVTGPIYQAVMKDERFIAYSSYARQIEPYLEAYGPQSILPVFFERLVAAPEAELARICSFIGDPSPEPFEPEDSEPVHNASSKRIRRSALRDAIRHTPLGPIWRALVAESWRARIKSHWQLENRPDFDSGEREELERVLDRDLARLGDWLGCELTCAGWQKQVAEKDPTWSAAAPNRRG